MLDGVKQGAGESGCTERPGDKVDMKAEERIAAGFVNNAINEQDVYWVGWLWWRPTLQHPDLNGCV